jgi:hypothetical protein
MWDVMQLEALTPGWRHVHIGIEGAFVKLNGLNPWKLEWHSIDKESIVVAHPSYPSERHYMRVYEIESAGKRVKFAAGEFSNGVWGFYVPS